MRKIKVNDRVVVIAGKDKGKIGNVLKVIDDCCRAVVEGINLVVKHKKPNPQNNVPGEIVRQEAAIHLSNLAVVDNLGKASRIGFKFTEDGKKVRYFKTTGEIVDI